MQKQLSSFLLKTLLTPAKIHCHLVKNTVVNPQQSKKNPQNLNLYSLSEKELKPTNIYIILDLSLESACLFLLLQSQKLRIAADFLSVMIVT